MFRSEWLSLVNHIGKISLADDIEVDLWSLETTLFFRLMLSTVIAQNFPVMFCYVLRAYRDESIQKGTDACMYEACLAKACFVSALPYLCHWTRKCFDYGLSKKGKKCITAQGVSITLFLDVFVSKFLPPNLLVFSRRFHWKDPSIMIISLNSVFKSSV